MIDFNVNEQEYHKRPEMSASWLKKYRTSAAHALHAHDFPQDQSSAMRLGTLVERWVLEPSRISLEPPAGTRNSKAWKDWAEDHQGDGTILVTRDEFATAKVLADAVLTHPVAGPLFRAPGNSEVMATWTRAAGGGFLDCRMLADRVLSEERTILELKTTRDASPSSFSRDCEFYGYHLSGKWYIDGLSMQDQESAAKLGWSGDTPPRHLIVAVETGSPAIETWEHLKDPTLLVRLYELEPGALAQAAVEIEDLLDLHAQCVELGKWPGYPTTVQPLALPKWSR